MRMMMKKSTPMIAGSVVAILALGACKPRAPMIDESVQGAPQSRTDTAVTVTYTPAPTPAPVLTPTPTPTMTMDHDMGAKTHMAGTDSMRAHMREMERMDGEKLLQMLPMHRDMTTSMLARLTTDRQTANVPTDVSWNATADSVRQDLTAMTTMTAVALKDGMVAHHGRLIRLMDWNVGMKR
jgi:hypothetical protein